MKVEIVEWHGFSTWHWDIPGTGYEDELCGICRVSFDGTCPNCKYPGDGCPIVIGNGCTHNFHLHCIIKWLEQDTSKGLCPMCRQIFVFKEGSLDAEEATLQKLIESHRIMRERSQQGSEDFEAFEQTEE